MKSLEVALAELESARKVNSLQREQLDALAGKIRALEDLVKIERERAEAYRTAAAERATANQLDERRVTLFEQSLAEFKAEVARLRDERDAARRSRNRWAVVGVGAVIFALITGARK